jgi:hypothetical protein
MYRRSISDQDPLYWGDEEDQPLLCQRLKED